MTPAAGQLEPGKSLEVVVRAPTEGMASGNYPTALIVRREAVPELTVPLALHILSPLEALKSVFGKRVRGAATAGPPLPGFFADGGAGFGRGAVCSSTEAMSFSRPSASAPAAWAFQSPARSAIWSRTCWPCFVVRSTAAAAPRARPIIRRRPPGPGPCGYSSSFH